MNVPKIKLPKLEIKLDWRAYYENFCKVHGDPVVWKGVQLFRDGWTYSVTDYQGPEWPPPKDALELARMQRAYWILRKKEVRKAMFDHEQLLRSLELAQSVKSQPIRKKVIRKGDDGVMRQLLGDDDVIDTRNLKSVVQMIEVDLIECDANIEGAETCIAEYQNLTLSPSASSRT